jgi:hypothetical protein
VIVGLGLCTYCQVSTAPDYAAGGVTGSLCVPYLGPILTVRFSA